MDNETFGEKIGDFLIKIGFHDYSRVDESTRIELAGRSDLKYIEGDQILYIAVTGRSGNPNYIIHKSSIQRWEEPHADQEITDVGRERILRKSVQWLNREKLTYRIE